MEEKLKHLINEGLSIARIGKELNLSTSQARNLLDKYKLKTKSSKQGNKTWTEEQLIEAVKSSYTLTDVIGKLGLSTKGAGNWKTINKYIVKLELDTSHFYGQAWVQDIKRKHPSNYELSEVLIENSTMSSSNLLKKLVRENVKKLECEECEVTDWRGKKLSFELDHINGNNTDNRIENLRVLCPNCHSQTPTWRRSKTKKVKRLNLCHCGANKTNGAEECRSCYVASRKIN